MAMQSDGVDNCKKLLALCEKGSGSISDMISEMSDTDSNMTSTNGNNTDRGSNLTAKGQKRNHSIESVSSTSSKMSLLEQELLPKRQRQNSSEGKAEEPTSGELTMQKSQSGNTDEQNMEAADPTVHQNETWQTVQNKKNRRQQHSNQLQKTNIQPTFLEFPVTVMDNSDSDRLGLKALEWELTEIITNDIGPITSIKTLGPKKFIIGCVSAHQQSKLANKNNLRDVPITCQIPTPSVDGVVRGIPKHVSEEEVLRKIDQSSIKVKAARRLTLRNGELSQAFHITFQATNLPASVIINKREYALTPYVHPVLQCHRCHKLGHPTRNCTQKNVSCAACGQKKHTRRDCNAPKLQCINCKGEHAATAPHCPIKKDWLLANKIRSATYMPKAMALISARNNRQSPSESQPQFTSVNTAAKSVKPPSSVWKPENKPTWAEMVARRRKQPLIPTQTEQLNTLPFSDDNPINLSTSVSSAVGSFEEKKKKNQNQQERALDQPMGDNPHLAQQDELPGSKKPITNQSATAKINKNVHTSINNDQNVAEKLQYLCSMMEKMEYKITKLTTELAGLRIENNNYKELNHKLRDDNIQIRKKLVSLQKQLSKQPSGPQGASLIPNSTQQDNNQNGATSINASNHKNGQ